MPDAPETPADRVFGMGERILAVVLGLVFGAIGGLVVVLLGGFFGDAFLPVMATCTVGLGLLGGIWPRPFLFVVEVVLGIFSG